MCDWIDKYVRIPEEASGPVSGPMRTSRVPIMRGLFDIIEHRNVHWFAFCARARIGNTLLAICALLYWIAEKFGAPGWLEPTRNSAIKLVRGELDAYMLQCEPVRKLAIAPPPHPAARKFWTAFLKYFRGKLFRIVFAGAEGDLHGFNLEFEVINEEDQQNNSLTRGAVSSDKFEARTALFEQTRKILNNSTPGKGGELSPIWQKLITRSQRYCYVPCPHCSTPDPDFVPPKWEDVEPGRSPLSYDPGLKGWQRLTFSIEQKLVPFDDQLKPLPHRTPKNQWREETTGQFKFSQFAIYEERPRIDDPTQTEPAKVGYNLAKVKEGTTYECARCKQDIARTDLIWMENRFRWIPHNPDPDEIEHPTWDFPPRIKESAHCWSAYNPFQFWGVIAREFIEARGDVSKLIKFDNLTRGVPHIRVGSSIKEDDLDRAIKRCPRPYVQGQMPFEAELLTLTIDRQDEQFWWGIRAWGILWDHPDWPTWSALIDWGEAVSWQQILERGGLAQNESGRTRKFKFVRPDRTEREYIVTAGLADSGDGDHTKDVYEFCLAHREIFSPYKGGSAEKTLGNTIRLSPILDNEIDLVWAWSDFFADNLYFDCIKHGQVQDKPVLWWIPTNIDQFYRTHLTDEYRGTLPNGKPGYLSRTGENHLGDMEKMQRVFDGKVEDRFNELRDERRAELAAKAEAKSETAG